MFESLELAAFGNRIPFLTFEVVADDHEPTLAEILSDASWGCIDANDARSVVGYAATGKSMSAAIQPLVDTFDIELTDVGETLVSPATDIVHIGENELGCSSESSAVPRLARDQDATRSLPASALLTYYDPERDYQSGLARADGGARDGLEIKLELPAVLSATDARPLAEEVMARSWTRRDQVNVTLPPARMGLLPGSKIEISALPGVWRVESSTVDAMAVAVDLRPAWHVAPEITADAGRANSAADRVYGPAKFALAELPSIDGTVATAPTIYLAAGNATDGWRPLAVEVAGPNWTATTTTAGKKSVIGSVTSVLAEGTSDLIDELGSVDVQLTDPDQWLTSCDGDALIAGANLALIGSEILQFGTADPLGGGAFRLSRLLRGRGGSEWAITCHVVNEPFVLLEAASLRLVPLPEWASGTELNVRQPAPQGSASASLTVTGDSLRPWSPVALTATLTESGDLDIAWTRRSRVRSGWLDDVDMPLGEQAEAYSVAISGGAGSADYRCSMSAITVPKADLIALGSGAASVAVRQIGDWGASRAATTEITLD